MKKPLDLNPAVFTLHQADVTALLDRLGLHMAPISPLFGAMASRETSEEALQWADDSDFADVLGTLAAPDRVVRVYAGGGMQPRGDLFMCIRPNQHFPMVAITPSVEESWVILGFSDTVMGTRWLTDTLAGDVEDVPQSPFPETFPLRLGVYIWATIDQFRRSTYEQLLDFRADEPLRFTLEDFSENIRRGVQAGDIRWALPAFIALTPGIGEAAMTPDPSVFNQLLETDMMFPVSGDGAGLTFTFGEVGQDLGIEFYRTWVKSAGIEVRDAVASGYAVRHRAYLSVTMWANHMWELLNHDEAEIRYAPMAHAAVLKLLESWIQGPMQPEAVVPVIEIPQSGEASVIIQDGVCDTCGAPMLPDAQFCSKCGTPKADAALICASCGAPLKSGQRFCTKCGTPVAH